MADTFRFTPPAVRPSWIDRPRLTRLLDRRFDADVLVVIAPAGYGKTSALGQALAANADHRLGTDLWFQCEPRDEDAEVLARGILAAAGLPVGRGSVGTPEKVADALLRLAPQAVCLVLDDCHRLPRRSPGAELLSGLVELLPTNAHLLLSGRTPPPVRLARLRAQGRVSEVGADDFSFDDDELDVAVPDQGDLDRSIARWPAMAALLATGSASATVDFLLEEVAGSLGGERLATLTALSHVRTVDDGIALAASGDQADAATLLADLPLVQHTSEGAFQMHDLWRDALVHGELDEASREALRRVAAHLQGRGWFREASELFVAAGDLDGAEEAVRHFARQPLMVLAASDLREMAALTNRHLGDRPLADVLEGTLGMLGDERASAEAFEAAAERARADGDLEVEGLALQYAANMRGVVDPAHIPEALRQRAAELDSGDHSIGSTLHALLTSYALRSAGDPEGAAACLEPLSPSTSVMDRVQYAFAVCDLGRPEDVGTPDPADMAGQGGGEYLAQAVWLRGDLSPEVALEFGRGLADASDVRQVPHVQISVNGVLTFVACAAGDVLLGRKLADRAGRWVSHTASPYVRAFASLADATCLLTEQGEEVARDRIARTLEHAPIEPWPYRAYLYVLPLVYTLAPETRAFLDGCRFGPALTVAQGAGRALVALREHDDPEPATALPWDRPNVLRAHVLPPHLAQLAAAAAAAGDGSVGGVLDELPSLREHLVEAGRLSHASTASWAQHRVDALPARPHYDLRVDVLGPLRAARGATPIADEAWVRRDRVRQLLAHLLLHRRVSRRRVAEELWPELTVERALQNLRVNLSHLQRVLQPGREADERPWFVRADAESLEVAPVGLDVDTDRFERACRGARRFDEQAQGTRAIDGYRTAAELFRGDYLEDWPDAEWAAVERVRLRTLATASMCRLGELLLARGEPEEATAWASAVLRHEPLLEQAHRLFIRGLAGQGNRPASAAAALELLARLADEGLVPERETERLAEGLGVG